MPRETGASHVDEAVVEDPVVPALGGVVDGDVIDALHLWDGEPELLALRGLHLGPFVLYPGDDPRGDAPVEPRLELLGDPTVHPLGALSRCRLPAEQPIAKKAETGEHEHGSRERGQRPARVARYHLLHRLRPPFQVAPMLDSRTLSQIGDKSITKRDFVGNGWLRKHYIASDAIIRRVKVGIVREVAEGERRVGLVPETVGRLVKDGFEVVVESGAGRDYNLDENYEDAGATVVDGDEDVYGEADLIVKVAAPTEEEIGQMSEGQVLICFLNGPQNPETVEQLSKAGVTVFSNEAIPRTSVAQSMDALSSMGSIAGYKCALIGADTLGKYVPMLSTAAGTTKAANILVLGVAVAGLQAIAIMNRLGGAVVARGGGAGVAYGVGRETKEQAQSLGASFIDAEGEEEEEEEEQVEE